MFVIWQNNQIPMQRLPKKKWSLTQKYQRFTQNHRNIKIALTQSRESMVTKILRNKYWYNSATFICWTKTSMVVVWQNNQMPMKRLSRKKLSYHKNTKDLPRTGMFLSKYLTNSMHYHPYHHCHCYQQPNTNAKIIKKETVLSQKYQWLTQNQHVLIKRLLD